jgi:RNA polymerase sigma-70 factor (ECF subfamily)
MDDHTKILTQGLTRCDEIAWRAFHEEYHSQLHRMARARGASESDAPEIIQGVYLRVLRHAKVIPETQAFIAWLACLVRCEVIDHARRRTRRNWLNERIQQWQESRRQEPSTEITANEELATAMQTLEACDRALLEQHYLEGWSQKQLAEHHHTTVKAVESKLARLRKHLRQSLECPTIDPS